MTHQTNPPRDYFSGKTADPDLYLPVDGLSLLGEHQGSGYSGHRFLVGRGDGQVIQLPLLLYLIMAAIAEGSVDGGWSADQVGARVGAASGRGLAADNVRYLIASKLAPLGLIAADGADCSDGAPGAAQLPRVNLLSGLKIRRQRWALVLGGTAMLVSVAAAAPMMAGTGNREAGGTRPTSASTSVSASASASAAAASRSQAAAWVAQQVSRNVAEMTALASAGRQLLGNKDIRASPSARAELRAGQVDARLLAILALLAAQLPIRLVSFTSTHGAGPGAPLRAAEISVTSAASRSAVLALLDAQQGPYRPTVALGGSPAIIALRFDAPAPLNMSQP
jgi:hypothetical protein